MYSIIVPCYNEEGNIALLAESFKNVKNSIKDLEVILVNNGSKDNTKLEIEKVVKTYKWIKLVDIVENRGYGYGIYTGLKNSCGDWKGWIHADLQFSPDIFLKFIKKIEEEKRKDILFKGLRKNRPILDSIFTIGMSIYESIYLKKFLWDINAQPTLLHNSLFLELKDPPLDFSFDLYVYYMAKKMNYNIFREKVIQKNREFGESSWNTGISSRINLIKRVINYSKKLKNRGREIE